jgi:hypothetical protein
MHLNTEELVDIAEGTRLEMSAPHLAGCAACRAQLADLRAMLSAAQDVDVPEPSPLFWDHLSSRVSAAVAAEAVPRRSWLDVALWRRTAWDPISIVAVAVLLLVVVVKSLITVPAPAVHSALASAANTSVATELLSDVADDDASLTLVASLTDEADLDTVREAGLVPRGSAEHAITHMSDGELRELGRLLKEELTRPGA